MLYSAGAYLGYFNLASAIEAWTYPSHVPNFSSVSSRMLVEFPQKDWWLYSEWSSEILHLWNMKCQFWFAQMGKHWMLTSHFLLLRPLLLKCIYYTNMNPTMGMSILRHLNSPETDFQKIWPCFLKLYDLSQILRMGTEYKHYSNMSNFFLF